MDESLLPPEIRDALDATVVAAARSAYDSPGRRYHTWAHIEACLREARGLRLDDAAVVYAALLFHDAVYVTGAKDNEAQSAQLAARHLQGRLPAERIARVEYLILLTASHDALPTDAQRDDKLLVDIDLSVLAAAPQVYARYARNVRDEWVPAVVNAAQYAQGRAAFLRRVLAAPRLFHSPEFAMREAAARANIAEELAAL